MLYSKFLVSWYQLSLLLAVSKTLFLHYRCAQSLKSMGAFILIIPGPKFLELTVDFTWRH